MADSAAEVAVVATEVAVEASVVVVASATEAVVASVAVAVTEVAVVADVVVAAIEAVVVAEVAVAVPVLEPVPELPWSPIPVSQASSSPEERMTCFSPRTPPLESQSTTRSASLSRKMERKLSTEPGTPSDLSWLPASAVVAITST